MDPLNYMCEPLSDLKCDQGNQATAVSLNIRETPYRQETSIPSFSGKIRHVAIILLLILGACILNYLVFFVSKSLDKRCSLWIQTVRTWWQTSLARGSSAPLPWVMTTSKLNRKRLQQTSIHPSGPPSSMRSRMKQKEIYHPQSRLTSTKNKIGVKR